MTMVDCVKVYGKTKDSFGWPEDTDDTVTPVTGSASNAGSGTAGIGSGNEVDNQSGSPQQLSKLERLAMDVFKSLDSSMYVYASEEKFAKLKSPSLKIGKWYDEKLLIFIRLSISLYLLKLLKIVFCRSSYN